MSYRSYRTCDGLHETEVRLETKSDMEAATFSMLGGNPSFDLCRDCKSKLTVLQAERLLRQRVKENPPPP